MPACQNCGGFVSSDFERVFGDNDDRVQGCIECVARTGVREGGVVADPQAGGGTIDLTMEHSTGGDDR
ncbi:hypothetical protein ACFQGT_00315 [Natrialbaceae archaeon GCM10025810]